MGRRSRKSKRRMNSLFMALLLTAVMLIMSTYAWFSANRVVTIDGITAKVSAAEGLQISLDGSSWSSSVTVNSTTLAAAASYNNYVLPEELHPVSTTGATSSAEISFFDGQVSADGATLNNAAAATAAGKFIVFDAYLKNSSSLTEDNLQLGMNSLVRIGTTTGKEGQSGTGLEFSVRTAFALYPNTAVFTASQSDIAALTGTPLVSIWEPNYNSHIAEVVQNDPRVENSATSDFATLGLIQAGSGTISGINGTTNNSYMANYTSIRTPGTVTADVPLTDVTGTVTVTPGATGTPSTTAMTAGTQLKLAGNRISKVRVYIWLEGQDPDCIDTASTGKYLDFVINLTKPPTT